MRVAEGRQGGVVLSCLILMAALSLLHAGKPQITLLTSAVSPRLYMISQDEVVHWRSWASYQQSFGQIFQVQSHLEYGSENDHFRNPFRVHVLSLAAYFNSLSVRAGRIAHWNALIQERVDGGELTIKTHKLGKVKILGGFPAVTDFSDTSYSDKSFLLASWGIGRSNKSLSLSYWSKGNSLETNQYAGASWSVALPLKIKLTGSASWDLSSSELYYGRFNLSRRMGVHMVRFGIRSRKRLSEQYYSWITTDSIKLPSTATMSVISRLKSGYSLWNQLSYRFLDDPSTYFRSSLSTKSLQLTLMSGLRDKVLLLGGGLGLKKNLSSSLLGGCSLNINTIEIDGLVESISAIGFYSWLEWEPNALMKIRFFTRYAKNEFYKIDGRGGLTVHVAL